MCFSKITTCKYIPGSSTSAVVPDSVTYSLEKTSSITTRLTTQKLEFKSVFSLLGEKARCTGVHAYRWKLHWQVKEA